MKRIYENLIRDHFVSNRQMVFLSGPRQVGKTTLAMNALPNKGQAIKLSALDLLKVLV